MYDTLLQMGRWFGYRPGYDDLFKIWISTDAIDWYGYITAAAEELKLEISRMRDANKTPMEFGLKVRQDPASLIVTARNKMRTATFVKRPISVSGRLLETPRLRADISSLRQNEDVFKDFVKRLPEVGEKVEKEGARYFWQNVSKDEIEQLLRDFKTHPWHLNFQGAALADFISTSAGIDNWDVFIAEGSANEYNGFACGNELITVKPEKRTVKATKEQISISGTKVRVGTGGAAKIGLSTDQRKTAEKIFDEEYKKTHTTIPDKMNYPDSAYLEIDRPPVLILHVVSVDRGGKDKNDKLRSQIDEGVQVPDYLFALGIGIPANGDERIAYYMVNMVEFRSYYDAEEDDDE